MTTPVMPTSTVKAAALAIRGGGVSILPIDHHTKPTLNPCAPAAVLEMVRLISGPVLAGSTLG